MHLTEGKILMKRMESVKEALIRGLTSDPKCIPAWYRYDKEGSRLNDLCLDECQYYYFHRSEVELLKDIFEENRMYSDDFDVLIDLGSGNANKTRFFLNHLMKCTKEKFYIPVDISSEYLHQNADQIKREFKHLNVDPIAKDYLEAMNEIRQTYKGLKKLLWFGGGIMNVSLNKRQHYLTGLSNAMEDHDKLVVTLDVTDPNDKKIIEDAYLDPDGYCEAFYMNSLFRLNNEFEGNLDQSLFDIRVEFVKKESEHENSYVNVWIESKISRNFRVEKLDLTLALEKNEKIYLHEDGGMSSKFTVDQIKYIHKQASLIVENLWRNKHAAVVVLKPNKV